MANLRFWVMSLGFSKAWLFLILILLGLRLFFMATFPVIGDEAYYFTWGLHPSGGYYDLPPMIGWWTGFVSQFSLHPFWLRLPNLISHLIVAYLLATWLSGVIEMRRAYRAALVFALIPLPFFNVLMTPDTPLGLFSFLFVLFFHLGVQRSENRFREGAIWFLLSGACFGLAFLSKYFAVLLLIPVLIWFWLQPIRPKLGWLMFTLGGVPFLLQHLWWNKNHCYSNFIFNLFTRQQARDGHPLEIFFWYLFFLIVVPTPFLLFRTWRKQYGGGRKTQALTRLMDYSWFFPVFIFGLLAYSGKGLGIHWFSFLLPFFALSAGTIMGWESLRLRVRGLTVLNLVLSILFILVLFFPEQASRNLLKERHRLDAWVSFHPKEWIETLEQHAEGAEGWMTEGYTFASLLDYQSRRFGHSNPVISFFGEGSRFGRSFDWWVDWKSLDGKKLLFFARTEQGLDPWRSFFESVKFKRIEKSGTSFVIATGEGFRFQKYQDEVLSRRISFYSVSRPRFQYQCDPSNPDGKFQWISSQP